MLRIVLSIVALSMAFSFSAHAQEDVVDLSNDFENSRMVRFHKSDADGKNIDKNFVLHVIVKAMYGATKFTQALPAGKSGDDDIFILRGIQIDVDPQYFVIRYLNGEKFKATGEVIATQSSISIPYALTENKSDYVIELGLPDKLITEYGMMSLTVLPQLRDTNQLIADTKKIYANFNAIIPLERIYRGELNTPFNSDVIAEKFKRDAKNIQQGKDGYFFCDLKGRHLQIAVLPYQTGSKIKYEYDYQYLLDSKGGSSFDPKIVAVLEKNIQEVAQHK